MKLKTSIGYGVVIAAALIAMLGSNARAQDSALVTVTVKVPVKRDTVTINTCVKDTLYRGLYVAKWNTKVGDAVRETMLLDYCKRLGFNTLSFYDLGSILGTSTGNNKQAAFNRKCDSLGIRCEAVRGSATDFSQTTRSFMLGRYNPAERFDGFNIEYEFWRVTDRNAGWVQDSLIVVAMNTVANQTLVRDRTQYIGWFDAPVQRRAPEYLAKNTTHLLVHYYRTKVEAVYGKYRLDSLDKIGVPVLIRPIFSAEPDFMQNLFRTVTPDSAFRLWHAQFKAFGYKNLVSDGYQIFSDDFLMVSIAPAMPAARLAPDWKYSPLFENVTKPEHLEPLREQ
ncbi:MAG TPA: hypothetical protein PKZ07_14735 [Sedimentisphaerales bacterium]|nr:hypothetical protein [Sedimentisphaerales bacterium]